MTQKMNTTLQLINTLSEFLNTKEDTKYPPMNISFNSDDKKMLIEMGLCGWKPEELDVTVKTIQGVRCLVVKGEKKDNTESESKNEFHYIRRSLARRNFLSTFNILNQEVESVDLSDGLLTIMLNTPKSDDSMEIPINYKK